MLNINQLHREIEDRMEKKKNVYSKILELCYQRIVNTNKKNNNCYCFFSCPTFMFGVPLYNITNCIIYIMEDLTEKGFQVQYTHPNLLYISWKVNNKSKSSSFNQKKIEYNKYRDIMDVNKESLVYHPNDINNTIQSLDDLNNYFN
jgi:hypothetical protein